MGYDMRMVDRHGEGIYPPGYWDKDFDWDTDDPAYFRLNITGMHEWRKVMHSIGMLDVDTVCPTWVKLPEGISDEYLYDRKTDEWTRYEHKVEEFRSAAHTIISDWVPEGIVGIPAYKFGSNDGWLVTPEEIQAALTTYEEWYDAHGDEGLLAVLPVWEESRICERTMWGEWIDYLTRAANEGGFRVY